MPVAFALSSSLDAQLPIRKSAMTVLANVANRGVIKERIVNVFCGV